VRGGVIPFNMPGIHAHDVAQCWIGPGSRFGPAPLHDAAPRAADLPASARASFNVYSTREDIDALVAGLHDVQRVSGANGE